MNHKHDDYLLHHQRPDLQRRPSTITPPTRPLPSFDPHQLPLLTYHRLSHPSMYTPTHRISHHHKYHTWRPLHYLPQLLSNQQSQTRRLLPHVSLKTPYGQTLHLQSHLKLTT